MDVEITSASPPKEEADIVVAETTTQAQETESDQAKNTEQSREIVIREPDTRPVLRLSVKLIETYKHINKIYYEAKAKRLREQQGGTRGGVYNDGYDDQHYDYIIHGDEIFAERYILKHRIGKGSFGQVVCAFDRWQQCDVAVKIIKSKHAFMVQAQTEIRLLELTLDKDANDEFNVVRLLDTFVYRKHQCLVFEMLSYNLYELLKNTKFRGVSLALVRKFAKQILRALDFLCRKDVDIIHCDLKPENILLRHPKRSAIKIIDFGSSCLTTRKMYTYIQSRFYRSPEVLLGLPYSQKIDMWSLGCVLVEMHTGEPLFGGVDQLDQLNRIVNMMGMVPADMVQASPPDTRKIFFDVVDEANQIPPGREEFTVTITDTITNLPVVLVLKSPKDAESASRKAMSGKTLDDVIGVTIGGPSGRRKTDSGHSEDIYRLFSGFIHSMLEFNPEKRVSARDALSHEYLLVDIDFPPGSSAAALAKKAEAESSGVVADTVEDVKTSGLQIGEPTKAVRQRSSSAPRLSSTSEFPSGNDQFFKKKETSEAATDTKSAPSVTGAVTGAVTEKSSTDEPAGDDNSSRGTQIKSSDGTPSISKPHQDLVHCTSDGPMETSEVDDDLGR